MHIIHETEHTPNMKALLYSIVTEKKERKHYVKVKKRFI